MSDHKKKLTLLLTLSAIQYSCGKANPTSSELKIENGVVDYQSSPGVIGLYIVRLINGKPVHIRGQRNEERCTGTIVRHDLVLTAAHCLASGYENLVYPYQNLGERGGLEELESRGIKSNKNVIHPHYKFVNPRDIGSYLGADLAFLIFEKQTFTKWAQPLNISKNAPKVDDLVKMIGYGLGDVYKDGHKQGIRRSGSNRVFKIETKHSNGIRIISLWGSKNTSTAVGDSGGPLLNSEGEVVGTLTGGISPNSHYVNLNYKNIRKFINLVMRDPTPNAESGQNLDKVDFEDTNAIKQEITKKKLPQPNGHDEL